MASSSTASTNCSATARKVKGRSNQGETSSQPSSQKSRMGSVREILKEHPAYNAPQTWTFTKKQGRSALCRGCRANVPKDELCVDVRGALSVPFGQDFATPDIPFYFCPKISCLRSCPPWTNLRVPSKLRVSDQVSDQQKKEAKETGGLCF